MKIEVIIDGMAFSNLSEFYDEIEAKLTRDLNWRIGRNLNAFNDVLRGGFGVGADDDQLTIIWVNSEKSRSDLGFDETVKYLKANLLTCHPTNVSKVEQEIALAEDQKGYTLFDTIISIIHGYPHIELILD